MLFHPFSKVLGIVIIVLFIGNAGSAQTTLINYGSSWKYWANTAANAPTTNWKGGGAFDDSGWPSGVGRIGFGDDGEASCIPAGCGSGCIPGSCATKFTTTYFRTTLNIPDVNIYLGFQLNLIRDDGAVIYVNGTEVWRDNMPAGTIDYNTFAAATMNEGVPEVEVHTSPVIPISAFQNGNNVIAIELHQINSTSSDLGLDVQLQGLTSIAANEVIYKWSGAITSNSAKVNAKLTTNTTQARLVVSTSADLSNPIFGPFVTADATNNRMAAMSISGLAPNTQYYYAVESDAEVDNSVDDIGTFKTIPIGAFSYKFTLGSCLNSGTNHVLFNRMDEKAPLFFLSMGDFHYDNPNSGVDVNVHRTPYENNLLSRSNYINFFNKYPLAYVWDDHDFSGNDSDSTAAGKANARRAYREYVPHYPLGTPVAGTNAPVYQAFTIGRVHFILTDLRSARRTPTMMGAIQKQWFKDQCIYARDNFLMIAWMSSVSFGGNQADNWGGFGAERTELGNFFRDNNIRNMFIMSGDAHMAAIDNGTNHDFSTGSNNANDYPVIQAAGMSQNGSTKGGTYSEGGTFPNPVITTGQYGVVEVSDPGTNQVCITLTTYRVTSAGVESQLATYNFCRLMNATVPIKILSFSVRASQNGKAAGVNWKSEEASDCDRYIIERSKDGVSFSPITTVPCKGRSIQSYQFEDLNTNNGWNYYRIKSVQVDGKADYTTVQKVYLAGKMGLKITPNPVHTTLNLSLENVPGNEQARYIIYNIKYRTMQQGNINLQAGSSNKSIPIQNFPAGAYILHLVINGVEVNKEFIVQ